MSWRWEHPDYEDSSTEPRADIDRWWPYAEYEDLYTAMLFTVCLFVWDDIIDTNEHVLASDFEAADIWRQQSLAYFKYHLELSPLEKGEPYCPDSICVLFKEFGQRFCQNFGEGMSIKRLLPDIRSLSSSMTSYPDSCIFSPTP